MVKILIVDDDINLRRLVKRYAGLENILCDEAGNGSEALKKAAEATFDLIILDIMMPGMDGFETLTELRKTSEVPVIMLTAKNEEYDRLVGFDLGADDYVPKPFSPKELMARVKAVLKRSSKQKADDSFLIGDLVIKESSRSIKIKNKAIKLTPKEFDLLLFFIKNDQIVLSRELILKNVWGYDYFGDARTVDTHVNALRDHLGSCKRFIQTVWGVGYKFEYNED